MGGGRSRVLGHGLNLLTPHLFHSLEGLGIASTNNLSVSLNLMEITTTIPSNTHYLAFPPDTDFEAARLRFIEKYEVEPTVAYLDKGLLLVGPVPHDIK